MLLLVDQNEEAIPVAADHPAGEIGTLVQIATEHRWIHQGMHFSIDDVQSANSTSPYIWMMQTPNSDIRVHLITKWQATGACLLEILEGAQVSSPGTALQPVNNNRNSQKPAKLQVSGTPIVVSSGTRIRADHSGTTGLFTASPADANRANELILKKNTIYLVRATPDTGTLTVYFGWAWYEVPGPAA